MRKLYVAGALLALPLSFTTVAAAQSGRGGRGSQSQALTRPADPNTRNYFDIWNGAKAKATAGYHRSAVVEGSEALSAYYSAYSRQNPRGVLPTVKEMERAFGENSHAFIHRQVVEGIKAYKENNEAALNAIKVVEKIRAEHPGYLVTMEPGQPAVTFEAGIDGQKAIIKEGLEQTDFLLRQDPNGYDLQNVYKTLHEAGIKGDDFYDRDCLRYGANVTRPAAITVDAPRHGFWHR